MNEELKKLDDTPAPTIALPSLDEIEAYVPVTTPMDKKTIKNAILKRLPEVKRINLVCKDEPNHRYALVLVCQLLHEVAIIIEDDFSMMMRHKDLMNLVDRFYDELQKRKKLTKTNKLPGDFFTNDKYSSFKPFQG